MREKLRIRGLSVRDIRFPSSIKYDSSDAQLKHPRNFACAYVALFTDQGTKGFGLSVTPGPGTEIVVQTIKNLAHHVIGVEFDSIIGDFKGFCKKLIHDPHLRWMGPEKGVVQLAASAIINAMWDLWGRLENKPVWKLLVDMDPKELVSYLDFTHLEDALTEVEALGILNSMAHAKETREEKIRATGYPCYTDSGGCLGYNFDTARSKLQYAIQSGFTRFKVEVGDELSADTSRLRKIREIIGSERQLMIDANQMWEADEAVKRVKALAEFNPAWIEEPTSPDDVMAHAKISKALNSLGIGIAAGQHCNNRVQFKQLFMAGGVQYCQIDPCRLAGVNECVVVMLMAKKFGIPVCPHAGGLGLGEMGQHLAIFNYIAISGDRVTSIAEFSNHLHEHFMQPARVKHGNYVVPEAPGYSLEMITSSLLSFEYPHGPVWHAAMANKAHQVLSQRFSVVTSHGNGHHDHDHYKLSMEERRGHHHHPSSDNEEEEARLSAYINHYVPVRSAVFHDFF